MATGMFLTPGTSLEELKAPMMKQPSILAGRSKKRAPPDLVMPSLVMHAAHLHSWQRSPMAVHAVGSV
jgi:hypothetical protein